jgi:hypothetical protein
MKIMAARGLTKKLIPAELLKKMKLPETSPMGSPALTPTAHSVSSPPNAALQGPSITAANPQ